MIRFGRVFGDAVRDRYVDVFICLFVFFVTGLCVCLYFPSLLQNSCYSELPCVASLTLWLQPKAFATCGPLR